MADNDGSSGLRDLMPGVFSGITSALTALAGILGLLHEWGYFANRAPAAYLKDRSSTAQPHLRGRFLGSLAPCSTCAARALWARGETARASDAI